MKIKTKKEMNLPQLIEWATDNDVRDKMFLTENSYCVGFDRHGFIYFNSNRTMPLYQTFTVEVEEEITEDTEITALVELSSQGLLGNTRLYRYHSINDVIDNQSVAFYILNDDQTMDLIWKNGKLVE